MSARRRTPAGQRGLPLAEGDWSLCADDESDREAAALEARASEKKKPEGEDPGARSSLRTQPRLPDGTPAGGFDDMLAAAKVTLGDAVLQFRRAAGLHDNGPDGSLITFAWGAGKDRPGAKWVRACAEELERLRAYDRQARHESADVITSDRLS